MSDSSYLRCQYLDQFSGDGTLKKANGRLKSHPVDNQAKKKLRERKT